MDAIKSIESTAMKTTFWQYHIADGRAATSARKHEEKCKSKAINASTTTSDPRQSGRGDPNNFRSTKRNTDCTGSVVDQVLPDSHAASLLRDKQPS